MRGRRRNRKRIVIILVLALLGVAPLFMATDARAGETLPFRADSRDQWTGSVEQKLWGLMTIWSEAKFNFPFFDRIPDIDWDRKAHEYIPRVLSADSLDAYYDVLMEFAALLKDGHTAVVPPWMFVKPGHDHPAVELQAVGDKFIVARIGDNDEIRKQRILPGLEVLEIADHVPVRTYLKKNVLRFNSFGTPQADEAIGLIGIFSGPKDTQLPLKVRDPGGTVREVCLTRNSAEKNGAAFQWRWVRWYMFDPLIEAKMIQPDICYIRISNFGSEEVVQEFQKAFDSLALPGIQGLILDIRYNSGGDSDYAYSLVSFLTEQPLKASKWKSLSYVPAYRSWGRPTGWIEGGPSIIEPRPGKRYSGPLVVLTGPGTFSAAEDFLVPLQYSRRAMLVGEKTAGSTGNPISVPLPGGGMFRVVSKRDTFPDGREFVGIGISSDLEVHPTQQDILEGKDSVLQKGIEVIRNWASHNPDTISVAGVIERYVQACGGQALSELKVEKRKGTLVRGQSGKVPFEMISKAQGKWWYNQVFAYGDQVSYGSDGTAAWVQDTKGVDSLNGAPLLDLEMLLDAHAPLRLREFFPEMYLRGKEKRDGREMILILAKSRNGRDAELAFDEESGLLAKAGDIVFEDYRSIGKVKWPHRIYIGDDPGGMSLRLKMEFTEIVQNDPVDDSVFSRPSCALPMKISPLFEPRRYIKVSDEALQACVGVYQHPTNPGLTYTVTRQQNHLMMDRTGWGQALEIMSESELDYSIRFLNYEFHFVRDSSGRVTALELGSERSIRAERIE